MLWRFWWYTCTNERHWLTNLSFGYYLEAQCAMSWSLGTRIFVEHCFTVMFPSTLNVSFYVYLANPVASAASSDGNCIGRVLYTPNSSLFILYSPASTVYTTLYAPHFTVDTSHSTIPTSYPRNYIPHSTPYTPPHSALHSLQRYGNRGRTYKTVRPSCFTDVFYVTAFGFVGFSCLCLRTQ